MLKIAYVYVSAGLLRQVQRKRALTKVPGRDTMPSVLIAFITRPSRYAASAILLATALSRRALI